MLVWAVALVVLIVALTQFGGTYSNSFKLPGSEAQAAQDLLVAKFPARSGDSSDLVFQADAGIADPAIRQRIEALIATVKSLPGVTGVDSPYDVPGDVAPSGEIAHTTVQWGKTGKDLNLNQVKAFIAASDAAAGNGLRVEEGGRAVAMTERSSFSSEAVGLIAAVFILLIAFGSVVAMGLPIGAALFALGSAFPILGLAANFAPLPEFAPQFAAMIGIGVGIDYSLLVVTRFREGLHTGKNVEESIVAAVLTSGRAVIFAGVVVAVAFLGLFAMGLPFVAAMGAAGAIVVGTSVLVALTLMPALLSLAGKRIDSWRLPFLHSTEGVDVKSGWYRLSRAIQRRPVLYLVPAAATLLVMAIPVFSMHLGFSDNGNNPTSMHSRRSYDLLKEGFGPGSNGPLTLVADLSHGGADKVDAVKQAVAKTPGIVQVGDLRFNAAKDTAVFTAIPSTSQQDSATADIVNNLRDNVLPSALGNSGGRVLVAGQTAASVDIGNRISSRLPLLFGGVIGLSFLLLMAVFRSVLVAVKAAVMNLLSIGASYGVLVAVFQWGWGAKIIGIEKGPVETFLPMMLFAILFGLSMDYEVFLISRIREEYLRTKSNATAVSNGLAATARVITAAAAIMVTVFISFVFGDQRVIKEFGIGLATAIFVDATVVRLFLVPATMELLGDANWWLPKWLDRILPHINVEGPAAADGADAHAPLAEGSPAGGR
jgi:putative drug exporter of the RND superfamily